MKDITKRLTLEDFGVVFSVPRVRENGTEEKEVGGGSGFIVSNDGLIVIDMWSLMNLLIIQFIKMMELHKVDVLARDKDL